MEKIKVNAILEVLGRPKEHLESSIKNLVSQIGTEKGLLVTSKKFHEAVEVKDSKDLFTTFTEISLDFDSVEDMLQFVFKYLPSNIEVSSPSSISLTNQDLTFLTNRLAQKLHQYDAIVKNTLAQKDMLARKLKEVAPHLFKKIEPKEEKKEEIKKEKDKKKSKKKN